MAVKWLRTSARVSSSSVLWFSRANTTTGSVAAMPWLPLPELLITGIIAPAILASHAQEVALMMWLKMLSPMMPLPSGRESVLPSSWP